MCSDSQNEESANHNPTEDSCESQKKTFSWPSSPINSNKIGEISDAVIQLSGPIAEGLFILLGAGWAVASMILVVVFTPTTLFTESLPGSVVITVVVYVLFFILYKLFQKAERKIGAQDAEEARYFPDITRNQAFIVGFIGVCATTFFLKYDLILIRIVDSLSGLFDGWAEPPFLTVSPTFGSSPQERVLGQPLQIAPIIGELYILLVEGWRRNHNGWLSRRSQISFRFIALTGAFIIAFAIPWIVYAFVDVNPPIWAQQQWYTAIYFFTFVEIFRIIHSNEEKIKEKIK